MKPAMTPDEWRIWREDSAAMGDVGTDRPDDAFLLMATQNERLPADDPRKITRAELEPLRLLTAHIPDHLWDYCRRVERLRAKLAALLPPE